MMECGFFSHSVDDEIPDGLKRWQHTRMDEALRISTRESLSAPACGPLHMLGAWGRCRRDTAKRARSDAQGDRPDSVGMPETDRSHRHAQADGRDGGSCPARVRRMRPLLMHGSLRGWPPVSRHTAPACAAVPWHNRRGMIGHAPQILGSLRGLAGTASVVPWPDLWR
jgi:hypothetical protein